MRIYGIVGRVLRGIRSFYDEGRACVRVGNMVSESFVVKMGLRQGCVMSPWMFNMFMDGVVREVQANLLVVTDWFRHRCTTRSKLQLRVSKFTTRSQCREFQFSLNVFCAL